MNEIAVSHSNQSIGGQSGLIDEQNGEAPILLQYWHRLVRWRWAMVGIMVVALILGAVATMLMTPQYTAKARLEISREEQNITNVQGIEPAKASQDEEFYQTQYSNLEARSLAQRVARSLRLASNPNFFAAHGMDANTDLASEENTAGASATMRTAQENEVIDILLEHVNIAPITRSRLIDIEYTSADPNLAATIANRWSEEFIAQSTDRRFSSTADARKFLESRLAELAQRLEESERRAVAYAAANDIVSLGNTVTPDGRTMVDRTLVSSDLEALNAALTQATADRIAAESRAGNRGVTVDTVANQGLSVLRQRRAEASAQYADLMVRFEPEYPQAREIQEQIKSLDSAIAREEGQINSTRATAFREAVAREASLRSRVEALKGSLTSQQAAAIQYNIFRREADTNRQLYDSLLQRYKEIGVAGVAVNNISIIDRAEVPSVPSAPNLVVNLALALVGGLGIAFVVLIALEQIDEGLREPGAVGRLLGMPLLGSVPESAAEHPKDALADSKSELSEAYFSVYSNLAFSTAHGLPKSLMVTSSRAQEGKTTTSVALAVTIGRTGRSVLLLDCDLRSPSCHVLLDADNARGVSNFLSGEEDWRGLIQATAMRGVSLISTGPTPPSAAELFSSDRLARIIAEAGQEYDHVVIDAPPLLGLADAPLISRSVEGVAFVIESHGVAVRGLRSALSRLRQAHARIFGAVVTKLDERSAGYGYGYSYGYGYGSQADD